MKTRQIQTAAKVLAVLAAALTMTGCIWFDWDFHHSHHHHDDRYYAPGARYEAPERLSAQGGLILPVTWNAPAGATQGESGAGFVCPAKR